MIAKIFLISFSFRDAVKEMVLSGQEEQEHPCETLDSYYGGLKYGRGTTVIAVLERLASRPGMETQSLQS